MKITTKVSILALTLILTASALMASGTVGIYGIVSRVVLEPNDSNPERIQIWGAFTLVDGGNGSGGKTLTPQRGYLYFALPTGTTASNQRESALKEWADFKAIAGTNQAVAFSRFGYIGGFTDELISSPASMVLMGGDPVNFNMSHTENPIRPESVKPASPSSYPLNMGLTKLSSTGNLAAIVKQLQQTLKP